MIRLVVRPHDVERRKFEICLARMCWSELRQRLGAQGSMKDLKLDIVWDWRSGSGHLVTAAKSIVAGVEAFNAETGKIWTGHLEV